MRLIGIVLLAATGLPAGAQEAAVEAVMEEQRCVWACLANFGPADDPAYGDCVQAQCSGEPGNGVRNQGGSVVAAPSSASASTGAWTYGPHPILGLSAHVQTEWGAMGFACGSDRARPASLRVTADMFEADGLTFVFDLAQGWSETSIRRIDGGVAAEDRTSCGHQIGHFRDASRIFAVDGLPDRQASGARLTIEGPGGAHAVASGSAAASIPGARVIGLRGSAAAIGALLAACPAMADMACD
ncbi:hypothetical protein [Rubellimicrobium aerolatum]|uniref:Uncharacterized protein n=1 Tax=Rubellimicrobium aerolatum TaxID=490979 RepID=A0ABW0S5U4_9RHOB|nr:hypothetical protein [Rubellimicrobium aerolatum]MBP1804600.1 hypothetical protein [Rubellimicrobium aerolatum]